MCDSVNSAQVETCLRPKVFGSMLNRTYTKMIAGKIDKFCAEKIAFKTELLNKIKT